MGWYDFVDIGEFVGKTFVKIEVSPKDDHILFTCDDGTVYKMYHRQDCCELVTLEEVVGSWDDLLNMPVLLAEEVSSKDTPPKDSGEWPVESYTWTFYKIVTNRGGVTLRWYGESNGYYSEDVDIQKLDS